MNILNRHAEAANLLASVGHLDAMLFESLFPVSAVLKLLAFIQASPTTCEDIASRSYLHENGFWKLVLLQDPKKRWKIQLRVWDEETCRKSTESDVHDHRWDFYSRLLLGSAMHCTFWTEVDHGIRMNEYVYEPGSGVGQFRLRYRGSCMVRLLQQAILPCGACYTLRHEVLHRVKPVVVPHVTFVVQLADARRQTTVLRETGGGDLPVTDPTRITPSNVQTIIARTLAAMDSPFGANTSYLGGLSLGG